MFGYQSVTFFPFLVLSGFITPCAFRLRRCRHRGDHCDHSEGEAVEFVLPAMAETLSDGLPLDAYAAQLEVVSDEDTDSTYP